MSKLIDVTVYFEQPESWRGFISVPDDWGDMNFFQQLSIIENQIGPNKPIHRPLVVDDFSEK